MYDGGMINDTKINILCAAVSCGESLWLINMGNKSNVIKLTSSRYSGSKTDASQRLFRMKMLGFDMRSFTLWKKCFSFQCRMKKIKTKHLGKKRKKRKKQIILIKKKIKTIHTFFFQ